MSETLLPITRLPAGGVSPAVIVCGDPARAQTIAAGLGQMAPLSANREYHAYRGLFEGLAVTVCSHGVGAAGAAPAFEELVAGGGTHLVRVGTCGGMQPDLEPGDLVGAAAAVQHTGLGREIAPEGYPPVADLALTTGLIEAAGGGVRSGVVLTRDAFYPGIGGAHVPDYRRLSEANVQAVEMECAALFLVCALRGAAAGAILVVDNNVLRAPEAMDSYQPHRPVVAEGVQRAAQIALRALREVLPG